jgi:hypothetical protein
LLFGEVRETNTDEQSLKIVPAHGAGVGCTDEGLPEYWIAVVHNLEFRINLRNDGE